MPPIPGCFQAQGEPSESPHVDRVKVIRWINGWLDESIQWPLKASRNWCFWALNLKFWKMWISRCYSTQIYWDEDCILVWLPSFSGGNLLLDLAHHTSTFGNRSAESPPHVSTTPLIYWKMVSTFESFQLHRGTFETFNSQWVSNATK